MFMKRIFLTLFAVLLTGIAAWIMYFLSSNDLNIQGGLPFMVLLNILFVANLALILYVTYRVAQDQAISDRWIETIKQIGGFAAAWGTWSTILGLFFAFDAIEASKEVIPFQVICGGLKVAIITVEYGLIIFCHSLLAYIGLNLSRTQTA